MVYILLGDGFEEIEAISPCDILRRGGVQVEFAGVGGREVTGSHDVHVVAERTVEELNPESAELVVVPGGLRGVKTIKGSHTAMRFIRDAYDAGAKVAAICAGPTVLGELGLMDGVHGVCYPGMESQVAGGIMSQDSPTVTDGRIITGRAAGASVAFGLALLRELRGGKTAGKVASDICAPFDEG